MDRRVHRGRRRRVRRADPAAGAPTSCSGAARILDVGCGDGQVSRLAWQLGAELVVGVDPTWNQIGVAHERGGGPAYVRGPAARLPFADASFDAVVACLVFEHIDDVDEAIAEVARVLRPGGRFCFFLNHPLLQTPNSGWIDDQFLDPPEQYWRIGAVPRRGRDDRGGREGRVHPLHPPPARPLRQRARRPTACCIERMDEPAPPAGFLARAEEYAQAATIPRLLYLRSANLTRWSGSPQP